MDAEVYAALYMALCLAWFMYLADSASRKGWHLALSYTVFLPATVVLVAVGLLIAVLSEFVAWLKREA